LPAARARCCSKNLRKRARSPGRATAAISRSAPPRSRSAPYRRYADYDTVHLGEDDRGAEITLSTCKSCGTIWLAYRIDEPHYRRSGRWWRVEIAAGDATAMSLRRTVR
jgi:hypothetical protein